jgi:hypothetical protein
VPWLNADFSLQVTPALNDHRVRIIKKPCKRCRASNLVVPQGGIEPPTRGFSDLRLGVYPDAEVAGLRLGSGFPGSPMSTMLLQNPCFHTLLVTPLRGPGSTQRRRRLDRGSFKYSPRSPPPVVRSPPECAGPRPPAEARSNREGNRNAAH